MNNEMPTVEATFVRKARHSYTVKKRVCKICLTIIVIISIIYTWFACQPPTLWQQGPLSVTRDGYFRLNLTYQDAIKKKKIFGFHWCRLQKSRLDWKAILSPCSGNRHWGKVPPQWKNQPVTDPLSSFLFMWDLNPAGEFSRFFIQSQTADSKPKLVGGDAWRVHLIGPAYIAPVVIDHRNGSYEVLFLPMEPGTYRAEIMLDYSLCNGLKDPPPDWFIKGNAQGKGQRYSDVDKNRDYLLVKLWGNNTPVDITIPPSAEGQNAVRMTNQSNLANHIKCDVSCNLLWDGLGRWADNKWQPYIPNELPFRSPHLRQGTLCVYGDSVSDFFGQSLKHRKICRGVFKHCIGKYNWIYPVVNFTIAKTKTDDLDFDVERVLDSVRDALRSKPMDNQSVFVINYGLHFVESVNFTSYQQLIDGLIKVFKETYFDTSTNKLRALFEGLIIWKSTSAINKQRASNIQLGHRRFLTFQRVLLYNAYAMWAMCQAGVFVLDVYPISDSYPWGTGTHGSRIPVPNDVVHYSNLAFKPAEDLLERIFEP